MSKKLMMIFAVVLTVAVAGPAFAADVDLATLLAADQEACDAPAASLELEPSTELNLGDDMLFEAAGEECNGRRCGANQFCCNYSCSICAPQGGACTQQVCS